MLRLWTNPEFVRHRRSELRQTRALAVAVVVIVVCLLLGLACWISRQNALEVARSAAAQFDGHWTDLVGQMERQSSREFWRLFYRVLMYIQTGVLTFWSLLSCAQAVSGEREHKTWDFQRVTRLSSSELLVGKLLGEPVLAYFVLLCCFPIAFLAGVAGGLRLVDIASAYALIICSGLFVGLGGLWLSSLFESRSRGIGLIGALGLYAFLAIAYGFRETNFPGFCALNPLSGLFPLVGAEPSQPLFVAKLFGAQISWFSMSLLLYFGFGAWFVLMLIQNLKRDYDEVRPPHFFLPVRGRHTQVHVSMPLGDAERNARIEGVFTRGFGGGVHHADQLVVVALLLIQQRCGVFGIEMLGCLESISIVGEVILLLRQVG